MFNVLTKVTSLFHLHKNYERASFRPVVSKYPINMSMLLFVTVYPNLYHLYILKAFKYVEIDPLVRGWENEGKKLSFDSFILDHLTTLLILNRY